MNINVRSHIYRYVFMSFTRFPCFTIFTCKSVNSINSIAILLLFIILAMLFVSCRLFDIYQTELSTYFKKARLRFTTVFNRLKVGILCQTYFVNLHQEGTKSCSTKKYEEKSFKIFSQICSEVLHSSCGHFSRGSEIEARGLLETFKWK